MGHNGTRNRGKARTITLVAAASVVVASCASAGAMAEPVSLSEEPVTASEFMEAVQPREVVDESEEISLEDTVLEQENPIGVDSPPSPAGAPDVHVIVENGNVYLRGTLPYDGFADAMLPFGGDIDEMGTVMPEFTIDPSVVIDPNVSAPVYINDTVLFETGSAQINEDAYPLLTPGLTLLELEPTANLKIVGHTDSVGDEAFNLALSQARVEAVREWLIANGAEPSRLIPAGMGEAEPIADNDTEQGRAENRRVEFVVDGM